MSSRCPSPLWREQSISAMKSKKGIRVPHRQPSPKDHLKHKEIATSAGRSYKCAERERDALRILKDVLGKPDHPKHEVIRMAAEQLAGGRTELLDFVFYHSAFVFLNALNYSWGASTTMAKLWQTFTGVIQQHEPRIAKVFAADCAEQFRWLVAGRIQALAADYSRTPEAIQQVEFWEDEKGVQTQVAVRNDGTRRILRPETWYDEVPHVVFPGCQARYAIHSDDIPLLKSMSKDEVQPAIRAGKICSKPLPEHLATETMVFNVALAHDDFATSALIGQLLSRGPIPTPG